MTLAEVQNLCTADILAINMMVGEPKPEGRRFWTAREIKVLKETYPNGGLAACLPALPGRSASSIYQKAGANGLLSPREASRGPIPRQRWTSNDQIDRLILDTYGRARSKRDIARLARTLGRPGWWVSRRAQRLGVLMPRFREPDWSEHEIQLISENADRNPRRLQAILKRHGYARTETAIVVKLKRIGADRTDPNHYTAGGLASIMGIDSKSVLAWINKGWLKAERRGTARVEAQGGDQWWIKRRDVAAFVIANVAVVNFAKADKFWLVDLLVHEGRDVARS